METPNWGVRPTLQIMTLNSWAALYLQGVVMNRRLISTSLLTVILGVATSMPVAARITIPDCVAIINWAAKGGAVDNVNTQMAKHQFRSGKGLLSGLKDENWVPVFGAPFPEATPDELVKLAEKAESCRLANRGLFRQLGPRDPRRVTLGNADSYIMFVFRNISRQKVHVLEDMARQKANYKTYGEAAALRAAQLEAMRRMQPTQENIAKIEAMTKEPLLAGLGAEYQSHLKALQEHAFQLTDLLLSTASAEFYKFPQTLAGMRDMIAFRVKTATELGKLKSRNWKGFNNAYATKLNELAQAALPEFVAELKAVPVSAEGKEQVRTAVAGLFTHQPTPRNIPDYHAAVAQRLNEIDAQLQVIACNQALEKHGIAKEAGTPLLGPDGESSLGAFVCSLPDSGHEFSSYEAPGLFGSTHTLTMLTPKGTTVTVEMKSVEAVAGKPKMLVGTRIKDATTSKELSMAAWQELAGSLTGAGSGPSRKKLMALVQRVFDAEPAGCVRAIDVQSVTAFPVTVEADRLSTATIHQFETLAKLGLFEVSVKKRPPPPGGTGLNAHTYTLTGMAQPYFKGRNGLCFAATKIEDVVNVSEPFQRGGRNYVTAVAKYAAILPDFALDPQFAAGVRQGEMQRLINAAKSGQPLQAKVAFVETDAGWQLAR